MVLLSSESVKVDAVQIWQDWQLLLGSVGLDSGRICPLLLPASKATLLRHGTTAMSPVFSVKLQASVLAHCILAEASKRIAKGFVPLDAIMRGLSACRFKCMLVRSTLPLD